MNPNLCSQVKQVNARISLINKLSKARFNQAVEMTRAGPNIQHLLYDHVHKQKMHHAEVKCKFSNGAGNFLEKPYSSLKFSLKLLFKPGNESERQDVP